MVHGRSTKTKQTQSKHPNQQRTKHTPKQHPQPHKPSPAPRWNMNSETVLTRSVPLLHHSPIPVEILHDGITLRWHCTLSWYLWYSWHPSWYRAFSLYISGELVFLELVFRFVVNTWICSWTMWSNLHLVEVCFVLDFQHLLWFWFAVSWFPDMFKISTMSLCMFSSKSIS